MIDEDKEDHPRSRGVYKTHDAQHTNSPGSSPLARGLQEIVNAELKTIRIIPARAGFTRDSLSRSLPSGDHPRSRGVYSLPHFPYPPRVGSSPLARGLLRMGAVARAAKRIIPARAGFTTRRATSPPSGKDHPRSRGVYRTLVRAETGAEGSSPLARGLRSRSSPPYGPGWIIPARAGFTHVDSPPIFALRIIPARAGFTGRPGPRPTPAPDHPRSRGVYSTSP